MRRERGVSTAREAAGSGVRGAWERDGSGVNAAREGRKQGLSSEVSSALHRGRCRGMRGASTRHGGRHLERRHSGVELALCPCRHSGTWFCC